MTNRSITTLTLRIAAIYLFTRIFDHFGSYFFSVYAAATMARYDELMIEPINKFYFTGTFLIVTNIVVSLFLFIKADWISKKLIKTDNEIITELNPKSLSKVILLTVGIIWFAKLVYLIPDLIDYFSKLIAKSKGNEEIEIPNFPLALYILKTILTLLIIFQIEKISNWIIKKI